MAIFSCKGCVPPKRHVGCHATCEDYIKESIENDKIKDKKQKDKLSLNSNGTMFYGKGYRRRGQL